MMSASPGSISELERRLDGVARQQRGVRAGEALAAGAAALVAVLGVAAALDNWLELPIGVRMVMMVGMLATIGGAMWWAMRQWARHDPLEAAALAVEKAMPELDNRLINAVRLARDAQARGDQDGEDGEDDATGPLIDAAVAEGLLAARTAPMNRAVSRAVLLRWLAAGAAVCLAVGAYALLDPPRFVNGLVRVVAPFAAPDRLTRTRIVLLTPGDADVLAGSDVPITVVVSGALPDAAELVFRSPRGRLDLLGMTPIAPDRATEAGLLTGPALAALTPTGDAREDARAAYRAVLPAVTSHVEYRVAAGDDRSDWRRINVHRRPAVTRQSFTVTPPAYTQAPAREHPVGDLNVLAGSTIAIAAHTSRPVVEAWITFDEGDPIAMTRRSLRADDPLPPAEQANPDDETSDDEADAGETWIASWTAARDGAWRVELRDAMSFTNEPAEHRLRITPDEPPTIELRQPALELELAPSDPLPLHALVTDAWGVRDVAVLLWDLPAGEAGGERTGDSDGASGGASDSALGGVDVDEHGQPDPQAARTVRQWASPDAVTRELDLRDELSAEKLGLKPGAQALLRLQATDLNDVTGPGVGYSPIVRLSMLTPRDQRDRLQRAAEAAQASLAELIERQQANLRATRAIRRQLAEAGLDRRRLTEAASEQEGLRDMLGAILDAMPVTLPIRATLTLVHADDMKQAVAALRTVGEPEPSRTEADLDGAIEIQRRILVRLQGQREQARSAAAGDAMRDVLAVLDELIARQKGVAGDAARAREISDAASASDGPMAPALGQGLARRQDALADQTAYLQELLEDTAFEVGASDAELASRFTRAAEMVRERGVRGDMIIAAARLDAAAWDDAREPLTKIEADLRAIAAWLREPVATAAQERLDAFAQAIETTRDKLDQFEEVARKLKELTEELDPSKDTSEGAAEDPWLDPKLAEFRDEMEELAEEITNDLNLFPDIPAANDLVAEMREVFSHTDQAEGSESDTEVKEQGVSRDDGLLADLKEKRERLGDNEMWLSDKPDGVQMRNESFDTKELGKVPLVDLPDELEDLVGELLDQAEDLDDDRNDSSSSQILQDPLAGWDVADGPMPSFSAKGKSGNTRPNENEQTGRSGAGREGMSSGEMVEGVAKSLEGSETEVRRTQDPFSSGYIEEEDPSKEARATGGGKMSGAGGEGGLSGTPPIRDEMFMRQLERKVHELRRNADALYTRATLMYLPTGELDKAGLLMQRAREQARRGDYEAFKETQQRIVHALRNTQRELGGQARQTLDPRRTLPTDLTRAIHDARDEAVPEAFESLVADYYKAIADGASQ